MSEKTNLEDSLANFQAMQQSFHDNVELAEMAEAENDESMLDEVQKHLSELQQQTKRGELEALLSGEVDGNDAFF